MLNVVTANISSAKKQFQKTRNRIETKFRSISIVHRLVILQFIVMLAIILWIGASVIQSVQAYMQILSL